MSQQSQLPEFLSRTEVARWLNIHPQSLANMASQHRGPTFMRTGLLQGKALYRKEDVLAWLQSNVAREKPSTQRAKPAATSTKRRHVKATSGK